MSGFVATDNDIVTLMTSVPNLSIAEYASRLGMHPAQLMQRMSSIPLRAALAANRAESLADACVLAESLACRAVNTVAMIMDSPLAQDRDRIAASKTLIDIGIKLSEATHHTPQIELLKEQLREKGLQIKEAKRYARRGSSAEPIASVRDIPEPITIPDTPPEPAENVTARIRDILRKGQSNSQG